MGLYVTENAQGRGIGGELLDYVEKYAVTHGYAKVFIWAFKENTGAVTFYRQHGYIADKEVYLGDYKAVGIRPAKML
ncbi:MAG: GNAT family N-acetyltransferase [Oscillospiraceae bacterium]|nr:GNAT family N-acetyltransferase [Oscillospiraceae bacterium]